MKVICNISHCNYLQQACQPCHPDAVLFGGLYGLTHFSNYTQCAVPNAKSLRKCKFQMYVI